MGRVLCLTVRDYVHLALEMLLKGSNVIRLTEIKGLMRHLLLACLMAITFFLAPVATFALAADLPPAVSDVSKKFSEKFCTSLRKGMTPEKAGQTAAVQLSQGLFFSPVMNEIMSAPKEDVAASLSKNIFDGCGNDLGGTKEELDDYLAELANKIPSKSKGLNVPPVRQKEPLRYG